MIDVYRIRPHFDDCQCVWYPDSDKTLFDFLSTGDRIDTQWKTCQLTFGNADQGDFEVPDFPPFEHHFLVANFRAWEVIRSLVDHAVEALPVTNHKNDKLYILNIINVINCLIISRCETNRLPNDPTGYFSSVHRYVFDEEAIRNEHLFRCPETKAFEMYASHTFRQLVIQNNLTGLRFINIYPPQEPRTAEDTSH